MHRHGLVRVGEDWVGRPLWGGPWQQNLPGKCAGPGMHKQVGCSRSSEAKGAYPLRRDQALLGWGWGAGVWCPQWGLS